MRRKANDERFAAVFSTLPGSRMPLPLADVEHAWYKFYAFVRPEALTPGWSPDRNLAEVNAAGVPCYSGSCWVTLELTQPCDFILLCCENLTMRRIHRIISA